MSLFDLIRYPVGPDELTPEQHLSLPLPVLVKLSDLIQNTEENKEYINSCYRHYASPQIRNKIVENHLSHLKRKQVEVLKQILLDL